LASLAPLVLDSAGAGDPVALAIVQNGADELAAAASAVARQLDLVGPVPVALAGGLLLASESYRSLVLKGLREAGLIPNPVTMVNEPAEGAVRLAGRMAER
jgi:N-acetylglucosamine kinase-like BadF-type ATPase